MPTTIRPETREHLKNCADELQKLVNSINAVIDGEKSLATVARENGMTPQQINRNIGCNFFPAVTKVKKQLTEEDIAEMLKHASVPSESLIHDVFGEGVVAAYNEDNICDFLSVLDDRARDIINDRYGLNGSEPATLDAVGKRLGLTRERVRQIQIKSLRKLKLNASALFPEHEADIEKYKKEISGLLHVEAKQCDKLETLISERSILTNSIEARQHLIDKINEGQDIDSLLAESSDELISSRVRQLRELGEESIFSLGMSGRATYALPRGGIYKVKELLLFRDKSEILRIRHVGIAIATEIHEKMKSLGMPLQDDFESKVFIDPTKNAWNIIRGEMLSEKGIPEEEHSDFNFTTYYTKYKYGC